MDIVEDIKARVNIADVVARYVPLKKAGKNFKALCPFHNEKTPSFIISPDKQMAYCFGCRRGGDIFAFIQDIEGLDFVSTLKLLAEQAGVQLPERGSFTDGVKKDAKERLYEIHECAAEYFSEKLWQTSDGEKVLVYLRDTRGLKDAAIREFRMGFAPDEQQSLSVLLLNKGYSPEEIVKAGVAGMSSAVRDSLYDRFRGRLMFPIFNHAGRVCAFGARALASGQEPKYLNSPETPLYHKDHIVFGLHAAKAHIKRMSTAIVMEGYMDVIQAHQAGFLNAVAASGTAFSKHQMNAIKRFADNVIFFFDSDVAGQMAVRRSIPLAQDAGLGISVVIAEDAKDPDEWIKKDSDAVRRALESAPAYIDFYIERARCHRNLTTINGKKDTMDEIFPLLSGIASRVEKDHYIQKLARLFGTSPGLLYDELRLFVKDEKTYDHSAANDQNEENQPESKLSLAEFVLGFVIYNPQYVQYTSGKIGLDDFDGELKDIYKQILDFYNSGRRSGEGDETVFDHLAVHLRERAKILEMFVEHHMSTLNPELADEEFQRVFSKFLSWKISQEKKTIISEMKKSEEGGDHERAKTLFMQYQQLLNKEHGEKN